MASDSLAICVEHFSGGLHPRRHGRRYLAGLFVSQLGHGRTELVEAAAEASELAFIPLWSYGHPAASELSERIAGHASGDLDMVSSPQVAARPLGPPGRVGPLQAGTVDARSLGRSLARRYEPAALIRDEELHTAQAVFVVCG